MAQSRTEIINNLFTTTFAHRRKDVIDGVYDSAALLLWFRANRKVMLDDGKDIEQPILTGKFPAGSYGRGSTFNTDVVEFLKMLRWNWKFLYTGINLHEIDVELNAGKASKAIDLMDAAIENAKLSLTDQAAEQVFGDGTGNNSLNLDGLGNGISRTGTYGELTRAATGAGSTIRAAVEDNTGGVYSHALLNELFGECSIVGKSPNLIITTQAIMNRIWERTQPADRNSPGMDRKVGFRNVKFNGADVFEDSHCPAGSINLVNTEFWTMYLHKRYAFDLRKPGQPTNQQLNISQLIAWTNIVCKGPRFQGVARNIT